MFSVSYILTCAEPLTTPVGKLRIICELPLIIPLPVVSYLISYEDVNCDEPLTTPVGKSATVPAVPCAPVVPCTPFAAKSQYCVFVGANPPPSAALNI